MMTGLRTTLLIFLALGATCDLRTSATGSSTPEHLRRREALARDADRGLQSYYQIAERNFFSEVLTVDDTVIVFNEGPFLLEASCKAITHTYSYYGYYDDDYYSYAYSYSSSSSYHDDYMMDEYSYTEYVMALDLTFTAESEDYVFGEPTYDLNYYNDEEVVIIGSYEAGESRNATVFKGYDGSSGHNIALRTLTGYYLGLPRDETVGIHRFSATRLPEGNSTFPEGVDCMIAGFINYVSPMRTSSR